MSFQQFQINNLAGKNMKTQCINNLIWKNEGKFKQKYQQWKQTTQNFHNSQKCKELMNFFEQSNNLMQKSVFALMGKLSAEQKLLKNASLKLLKSQQSKQRQCFERWYETMKESLINSKISDLEKEKIILKLQNFLANNLKQKQQNILAKFDKFSKKQKIQAKFMQKCLKTTYGKAITGFKTWKNLPVLKNKEKVVKMQKWEKALFGLATKKVQKMSFGKLKKQIDKGDQTKKLICNRFIVKCQSKFHRMFKQMYEHKEKVKNLEKVKLSLKLFNDLHQIISNNLNLALFDTKDAQKQQKKLQVVTRLFNSYKNGFYDAFKIWQMVNRKKNRDSAQLALHKLAHLLNNFYIKSQKQAFYQIRIQSETDLAKEYCNSLWKWKFSNVEAQYYSKFRGLYQEFKFIYVLVQKIQKIQHKQKVDVFRKIQFKKLNDQLFQRLLTHLDAHLLKTKQYTFRKWMKSAQQNRKQLQNKSTSDIKKSAHLLSLLKNIFYKNPQFFLSQLKKNSSLQKYTLVNRLNEILRRIDGLRLKSVFEALRYKSKKVSNADLAVRKINKVLGKFGKTFFKKLEARSRFYGMDGRAIRLIQIFEKYQHKYQRHFFKNYKKYYSKVARLIEIMNKQQRRIQKDLFVKLMVRKSHINLTRKMRALFIILKHMTQKDAKLKNIAIELWKTKEIDQMAENPWTKRAISYLTKNPKINPQISFFRLRDYALNMEQKLQEMKNSQLVKSMKKSQIISQSLKKSDLFGDLGVSKEKQIQLKLIGNIIKSIANQQKGHFFYLLKQQIASQKFSFVSPNKIEGVSEIQQRQSTPGYEFGEGIFNDSISKEEKKVMRSASLMRIAIVLKQAFCKKLTFGLEKIKVESYNRNQIISLDNSNSNSQSPIRQLEQDNELLKQVEQMRNKNFEMKKEIDQKEKELDVAYDSIQTLNNRITFMMTNKFMNIIERFQDGLKYHGFRVLTEYAFDPYSEILGNDNSSNFLAQTQDEDIYN